MAKLTMRSLDGRYCVTMSGNLSARDLRRLEQLCGPALEQKTAPLTLRLTSASSVDQSAQSYLEHLLRRGAVLEFE